MLEVFVTESRANGQISCHSQNKHSKALCIHKCVTGADLIYMSERCLYSAAVTPSRKAAP